MKKKFLIVLLSLIAWAGYTRSKPIVVTDLVCEYHTNPIGIDVAKPRLSWKLKTTDDNVLQTAYEIRVTDREPKGKLLWTSDRVVSDQSVHVEYGGPALVSMQRAYWQVRVWDNKKSVSGWSPPAFWEMGILNPEEWKASWIEIPTELNSNASGPCQYYRKEFAAAKRVKSARVYVSSHGLYQLYVNGQKVSADLFTPGWTSYNKRLQYQTYDVTSLIKEKNAIGAILGDGWYRGNLTWHLKKRYYGNKLAFFMQLLVIYSDDTKELVCTDQSWKVTNDGPIVESDIYNGETFDARKEMSGWSNTGFNDSHWENVATAEYPKDILVGSQGDVVKAIEELTPVKIITTPKGETVFDMGQNMVGWVRLKVQGKTGGEVKLRFAEVLDKDGNFYTANLRNAKATDTYIMKGEGTETFEPHFTFHGFRFVKVEGISIQLLPDQITGVVIHSDMQPTGKFTCSDTLINQLQHNIQWSQKGNFLDVPTDCPQRDERLGWTFDVQAFSPTAAFNFNVAPFYTKWMRDLAADQLPNGVVPNVIPDVLNGDGGSSAWGDAALIVPWNTYLVYNDQRILKVQYPSMKAWLEFVKSRAGDDLIWDGKDWQFGDWLAFASTQSDYQGATIDKELIATAYYAYSSGLLAKIALIAGKTDDAQKYAQLSGNIKKAFINEFVTPSGRLVSETQTSYALALLFDLIPEVLIPKAVTFLANDVKKMRHLTTGFIGTPLLCEILSKYDHDSLAFMLLNRKEYPSWLYPVTQGATTTWERWDGQKPDGSFQDVKMNSFNDYALGAIGAWLYQYIAGIHTEPESPGYKHFKLSPHAGGGLTQAEAELETLYGKIRSAWKLKGGEMVYEVTIPANTTALVTMPCAKTEKVLMNDKSVNNKFISQTDEHISFSLGSGNYVFRFRKN
jgi:alpha-L-rhamnosidase